MALSSDGGDGYPHRQVRDLESEMARNVGDGRDGGENNTDLISA